MIYGLSANGWMTQDLFHQWFQQHFITHIPSARPIILLMDHPQTINMAGKNKIILFVLPPNTSHITQPLDRACFAPLKTVWQQTCYAFCSKNLGRVVMRYDFNQLFSVAWFKASLVPRPTSPPFFL